MKSLKLNKLDNIKLNDQQMNMVRGGGEGQCCGCGCAWAGNGGSSIEANGNANSSANLNSSGDWQEIVCTFEKSL